MMTRSTRNTIAMVFLALTVACGPSWLVLFYYYFSSRPAAPSPQLGFIYPLSNHGSVVYIAAADSVALTLLGMGVVLGFVVAAVLAPRQKILGLIRAEPWRPQVGWKFETDLDHPTMRLKLVFLLSLVCWLAVIWFVGPSIARFVVAGNIPWLAPQ
jgi:hypothetical protein